MQSSVRMKWDLVPRPGRHPPPPPSTHALSLQLFPSTLIIAGVETQRPQLPVQSAALITLFHNSSKNKPSYSPQMPTLKIPPLYPFFLPKLSLSLSLLRPSPTPSPAWRNQSQMPWTFAWLEATPHSRLPRVTLKGIKTSAMKLMQWDRSNIKGLKALKGGGGN